MAQLRRKLEPDPARSRYLLNGLAWVTASIKTRTRRLVHHRRSDGRGVLTSMVLNAFLTLRGSVSIVRAGSMGLVRWDQA